MPLFAIVDGVRARATKRGPRQAACMECSAPMRAKTGDVVTHHWAHVAENPHCQAALESEWHLRWKDTATHEGVEVRSADGKRRADVLTPYGYAIEFQASALTATEVQDRENDWNRKLIWIFDAKRAYDEGRLGLYAPPTNAKADWSLIKWKQAPERIRGARCWALLDVGTDNLCLIGEWVPKSSPLHGYGWIVTRKWVEQTIINGAEPPSSPGLTVPEWAPSQEHERQRRAERERQRTRERSEERRRRAEAWEAEQARKRAKTQEWMQARQKATEIARRGRVGQRIATPSDALSMNVDADIRNALYAVVRGFGPVEVLDYKQNDGDRE